MRASTLAIGDEIVGGLTIDTNSPFLGELLRAAGVDVVSGFSVPDDEGAIASALERGLEDSDLVVSTGGLGPTADDLTTAAVARLAGVELRLHEPSLRSIEDRFRDRGLEMSPNNLKQARIPAGSRVVPNPTGTAPGFVCRIERGDRTRHVACLPGVPREMRIMAERSLVPWVVRRAGDRRLESRVFSTFGLAESRLDELLSGVVAAGEARLAFRAAFPRVQARITVTGRHEENLEGKLNVLESRIRHRLGDHLYAVGDLGLEEVVGKMLRERGLTLALAESCTGGLIGHRITDVPGSSEYFLLGIVAYANEAKRQLLGVAEETLRSHGAVSVETAEEMAAGVRAAAGADLGLAITGIAGPGGGSPGKPVGTVCVGIAGPDGRASWRADLGECERSWIKAMSAQLALDKLRRWLLGRSAEGERGPDRPSPAAETI